MDSSSLYAIGISIIIEGYLIGNSIGNRLICFNKCQVHKDETRICRGRLWIKRL